MTKQELEILCNETIDLTMKEKQDIIVRRFGLEHERTIAFFQACELFPENEWRNNEILNICFNALLYEPEEEEE